MTIESPELVVRQLRIIKCLALVGVGCLLIGTTSIVWVSIQLWKASEDMMSSSTEPSFSEQLKELLEQGKAKEILALAATREKTHPMDPNVHWYRGQAYHQLGQNQEALKAMQRTAEVAPTWRREHTDPFIEAINADISKRK